MTALVAGLAASLYPQFELPALRSPPSTSRAAVLHCSAAPPLRSWLADRAGVAPKFLDAVEKVCDDEMIGSVDNLATLRDAGLLGSTFKPVIAASIEAALGAGPRVDAAAAELKELLQPPAAAAPAAAAPAAAEGAPLPLREVKRKLMLHGQSTWGAEGELRRRLDMFLGHEGQGSMTTGYVTSRAALGAPPAAAAPAAAAAAPVAAPPPAVEAPAAAVAAPAPAAEEEVVDEAPTIEVVPAEAAPPAAAAPPADPNKATFTVTLKTESGDDVVYENPPDTFILDATDELELTDEHELPYACRAGGCSSCAGKVLSGEVDASGCSFLEADQIAAGYILTCSAIPKSDCVIQTHAEEDLF